MTIRALLVIVLIFFASATFAQEMPLKDGKIIPATSQWDFLCENYAFTGIAKIQVARSDKSGWLKIDIDTTHPEFFIAGVVYVYLSDHSVVVCTDKGLRTNSNGKATAWYIFSAAEMERLKKNDIESIRFNIRGKSDKFSSQTGNFTAVNKKTYFRLRDNVPQKHPTANAITELYLKP